MHLTEIHLRDLIEERALAHGLDGRQPGLSHS